MRGHRLRYGGALACLFIATLLNYAVPLVGTVVIDQVVVPAGPHEKMPAMVGALLALLGGAAGLRAHLWLAPVAMVAISAVSGVFSYLKGWQASLASDGIAKDLKDRLYDHLNHLSARYHDQADTGDLVQRCTSDVETTRLFLATQVMEIGNAAILAGIAVPLLLALNRPMTWVSLALVLPIVLYGYFYFLRVKHAFRAVDEAEGALTGVIQENLTGIRVVRAFARQDFERAKFAEPNQRYRDRSLRMIRLMSWYWSISDFFALGQIGLALLIGARWIAEGKLSVGVLFAILAYLGIMMWPVRQMGRILTDLGKTAVAVTRIREILAQPREIEPALPEGLQRHELAGHIVVRDLRFHHARARAEGEHGGALDGVSFEVRPGESLAILGPSGAGKSTLVHLLLRLYEYTSGSIRFDGWELSALPRSWIRRRVGVVMQEPFLFSKTLRENLRLGRHDAPDHEVEDAARAAAIHDTILSFEQGYGTLIGERGITLSGGQRQRVAIARAILKRPPVLILDDALSAIDAETEHLILDALDRRRGRATTLVIAHRLSTVAHVDRVIVLDHGRIIQAGTPAELAGQDGLYRQLWRIQNSLEADFAEQLKAV